MNKFYMPKCGIDVTLSCNLKCQRCAVYVPYFKGKKHFSLDELCDALSRYFKIVDYVEKFTLGGGEPLLFADIASLVHAMIPYRDKIGRLEIITNGTIVPTKNLLEAIKDYGDNFFVLVDNYGANLSVKISEIQLLLTEYAITHIVRTQTADDLHCGGWIDYGDLIHRKQKTQEEAEALYAKCAQPQKYKFCFEITNGVMYPCPPCQKRKELGLEDNYDEYINLFDDSLTIEEQRQKILNIYNGKSLSACAYCNGMCDDSERFVPAQQLTMEEMEYVKQGASSYVQLQEMMKGIIVK